MKLIFEILESFGLLICLFLATPMRFFRRLGQVMQVGDYAGFLIQRQLFSALLRARLDYRMGNFHQSVILLGPVVSQLEQMIIADRAAPMKVKRLLCTLYCDMLQLYFLCGQVEEAVLVVIRAHQSLGIDRLPSNPDLDLKTAHVIKAGLAASKLLEEGGLATLMVRQGEEPVVSRPNPPKARGFGFKPQIRKHDTEATIIPFPRRT